MKMHVAGGKVLDDRIIDGIAEARATDQARVEGSL
jgi:hypothetical protein